MRRAVEGTNPSFESKIRPSGNLAMSVDIYGSSWAFARLSYFIINLCFQETFNEKHYVSVRYSLLKEFIVYWGETVYCNGIWQMTGNVYIHRHTQVRSLTHGVEWREWQVREGNTEDMSPVLNPQEQEVFGRRRSTGSFRQNCVQRPVGKNDALRVLKIVPNR